MTHKLLFIFKFSIYLPPYFNIYFFYLQSELYILNSLPQLFPKLTPLTDIHIFKNIYLSLPLFPYVGFVSPYLHTVSNLWIYDSTVYIMSPDSKYI